MSKQTPDASVGTPERLGYWYLRLNGFFMLENFVIHDDRGPNQRTDADLIGVRFAHRAENLDHPMQDDPVVADCGTYINVVIAEVKKGLCSLNGPWTRQEDKNMHRVLKAIGCFADATVGPAAASLYEPGEYQTAECTCRLFAFGDRHSKLPIQGVRQVLFDDMINFIHGRFQKYEQKASVGSWTRDGQGLAEVARGERDPLRCRARVRAIFGLSEASHQATMTPPDNHAASGKRARHGC